MGYSNFVFQSHFEAAGFSKVGISVFLLSGPGTLLVCVSGIGRLLR